MQLPDNILRAHTPTLDENIKGAINDKDMPRRSKWTAWCDVAQSVTGGLLAIFLFCHMAFTSSIQISKDLFWNLVATSGLTFIGGHPHEWAHVIFVGLITLLICIHGLCALRRFPSSYHQCRDMKNHVRLIHHTDTTLWAIQIVTAVVLLICVFPHVISMLTNPSGIGPNLSGVHAYHDGLLYTFIFLVAAETHGLIGLYRVLVKWGIWSGEREGLRKAMIVITVLMILCGAATALKYYSIGADQVKLGTPAERYVPQNPWYDVSE